MNRKIAHVSVLVRDYDEAIAFYTEKLGFRLLADSPLGAGKRWGVGRTPGFGRLQSAAGPGRPLQTRSDASATKRAAGCFCFSKPMTLGAITRRCWRAGCGFLEPPRAEEYGTVAVFEDLYGNKWDLLQLNGTV